MTTLEQACKDIRSTLSTEYTGTPQDVVQNYFAARKTDSPENSFEYSPQILTQMEKTVNERFLPLYQQYAEETAQITEKAANMSVWKHIGAAIGIGELAELLIFKTAALRPAMIGMSIAVESAVGGLVYHTRMKGALDKVEYKTKKLEKSIKRLDQEFTTTYISPRVNERVSGRDYASGILDDNTYDQNISIPTELE